MALKFTLFIAVKNEIEGLKVIMPRIRRDWVDEVLILDAQSTDGSREYLREHGWDVTDQKTRGIRAAFWEAYDSAKGDVIILFSPDNNSIPEDVPKLVEKIREGFDLAVASRYFPGAVSEDDDFMSHLGNHFFTGLINLLFGGKYTDAIGMYKAFKIKHLKELKLDRHRDEHVDVLLMGRAVRAGLKIVEIPSSEPKRLGPGGSRAHPGALGKYKTAVWLVLGIVRDFLFYRP